MSPFFALLLVPMPAMGAFLLLGLGPAEFNRRAIQTIALAGATLPAVVMLPLGAYCLMGTCDGIQPIFDLEVGPAVVALALKLDPLSALVGVTVTIIGACVIGYSIDYMAKSEIADLRRYFALMNLFLASMLCMVLAGDSIIFFLGWELMGLCSFFLIAYHVTSARAIAAGRKAFVITRVADAFLLAALLLLFLEAGSVRLDDLIPAGIATDDVRRGLIAALLLAGAMGKSAQLPFHTWLPSAMAGPTPVSALLHSATMVAAGAYLLARLAPLMETVPLVMAVTATVGAATALFGATAAVFQLDVKRLLAYSSISQIGFMLLAIGLGQPEVAIAHFVVHAIFKSLLFLSAGDITQIARGTTDIAAMRGALRARPVAYLAFVAGAASLAGIPFVTGGWFSKEAILASAWLAGPFGIVLWGVALSAAVLTGAYAFRPVLVGLIPVKGARMTFGGVFTNLPILLLAAGTFAIAPLVTPMVEFLDATVPHPPLAVELVGAVAPFVGLALAFAMTFMPRISRRVAQARRMRSGIRIDGVYQIVFVQPFVALVRWLTGQRGSIADPVGTLPVMGAQWLVGAIVRPLAHDPLDRAWAGFASATVRAWGVARHVQSGRVRDYALAIAVGVALLLLLGWGTTWR
ncbi:NADH-quinone oxidoreductase subunit L [Rhodobaculum claviforme]|uniref:Oxidoreductase n=1 Tax=Rhodobaculum claviforme TaxID=1549854 RepID=A0A934TMG8_9RHOB|nr:proton-conducting transporter membrane subunit [Rhodobaculum claviforme]MBK5928820.1 oxidoreductase [Rhodobaculum claviforme]